MRFPRHPFLETPHHIIRADGIARDPSSPSCQKKKMPAPAQLRVSLGLDTTRSEHCVEGQHRCLNRI